MSGWDLKSGAITDYEVSEERIPRMHLILILQTSLRFLPVWNNLKKLRLFYYERMHSSKSGYNLHKLSERYKEAYCW